MANKLVFTDESLSTFVDEIKAYTDESSSTRATAGHGIYYGTCSTAAATAAKVVTLTDSTGFSLTTGTVVVVKFTYVNSVASPTLNVNGTGAKSIYRYGTTAASTSASSSGWRAGAVQIFVYDGTGWVRDFWENTTYANYSLGQGYGTCATAAATAAKVVTLSNYSLSAGGVVAVKFTYAVPASATMNINSKGAKNIYYRGAAITAGIIEAGDIATFIYDGTQYHLLSIDRWQSDIESLETALDAKQATITGGATTITSSNLTDSRALVSDSSGKVAVSAVTSTELEYLDGVTSAIQTQLDGKADSSHTHFGITTAGTGAAYTATVSGITALTVGATFVMIPHTVSTTTTPTLDVNGLGAKGIRRRLSNVSTTVQSGYAAGWLGANQPFTVVYNGTYWIVEGNIKTAAVDLYGTLAINKGGTGATTAAAALTNLGLTATAAELNILDGVTATTAELNYVDGVTSNIQTQLNNKLDANGWTTSAGHISYYGGSNNIDYGTENIHLVDDSAQADYYLTYPKKSGTIATTDDIPIKVEENIASFKDTSVGAFVIHGRCTLDFISSSFPNGGCYIQEACEDDDVPALAFYGYNGDEETILRHIATPIQDNDATNKGYVDNKVAEIQQAILNGEW